MSDSTKFEDVPGERESTPLTAKPKPGDVLAGKYRIGRILGEGGMGIVVEATHLQLRQSVALKFMLPKALGNKDAITRFEREARAAVRLKSPHVAKVLDTGTLENGAPYMVMEYLEGRTISSLVRASGGGLPIDEAIDYFLQACEGVAEAHALGVVHRDLKPSNLFLTTAADGSPTVKVLDFGVSKMGALGASTGDGEDEGDVTKTEAVVGSPLYMSPEQMKSSRDVDHRSDVWSLGVCLFEMLTGKVPFVAETIHQQYALLMLEDAPKPSSRRPDLPPAIDAIVAKCLQRDRQARYADVGELALALAPFAPEHAQAAIDRITRTLAADRSGKSGPFPRTPSIPPRGGASTGPGARSRSVPPEVPRTDVTWGGTTASPEKKPSRTPIVLAIAATLVAIGLAGALWMNKPRTIPQSTPQTSLSVTARATLPVATETASASVTPPAPTTIPSATALGSRPIAPATTTRTTLRPPATPTSDTVDLSHRK